MAVYCFAGFELDTATRELRREGNAVSLSSLCFELLEYLLRHRDRVVDADELRAKVWRGVAVTAGSLRQAVWELRSGIGDDSAQQHIIRTVRGRGYRFVAPLVGDQLASQREEPASPVAPLDALLGRETELAHAQALLSASRSTSGRILVVLGAVGMGKTRLVHELALRNPDIGLVAGRGEPDGVAPALAPWRSILRAYLSALGAERERFESRIPAAFGPTDGDVARDRTLRRLHSPAQQRAVLFEDLTSLLIDLARERPGIILLEDLQWVDEDALLFLTQLARELQRTRTFLLITCRPPQPGQLTLSRTLRALSRLPSAEQMELSPLTQAHVASMLAATPSSGQSTRLAQEVHALSRGNPLLTVELLRHVARNSNPLQSLAEQPELLLSVMRRRLEALEPAALRALVAGSVWGDSFSLRELSALLAETPEQSLAHLDAPIAEGILQEVGAARLRFTHPLLREVAYAALSRQERARLHRAAFEWLDAQGPDLSVSRLSELTQHAVEAAAVGLAPQAVHWSTRSAEQAHRAAAYAVALQHWDRALACLELAPESPPSERLALELRRAEARRATGANVIELNAQFLQLAERAQLLGEPVLFARAALAYIGQSDLRFSPALLPVSVDGSAVSLVERALAGLPETPSELRVLLHCSLMYLLIASTDRARRERLAAVALAEARALDMPALLARVLTTHIYCCAAPDQSAQRLAHCDELVSLVRSAELSSLLPDALATRAMCLMSGLEYERALRDTQEAGVLAATHRSAHTRARATLMELTTAFWRGDLSTAERLSCASLAAAPDDIAERALFTVRMAAITMLRSDVTPELIAVHERLLHTFPEAVTFRCALAGAYATVGRREEAMSNFDFAVEDDFRRLPEDLNFLSELILLSGTAIELHDAARARVMYDRLLPYGDRMAFYAGEACPAGTVAGTLGELAIVLRRYDLAEEWLTVADQLHAKLGARMFHHVSLLARARLLHAMNPHDLEAPLALVRKVRSFGERHVPWLVRGAERTARKLMSAAPRINTESRLRLQRAERGHSSS